MEIVNETVSELDYDKIDVNYDFSVNCEQFEVSKSSRTDVLSSTPRKSNFNVKEHIFFSEITLITIIYSCTLS